MLFENPDPSAVEVVDRENWRQIRDRNLIEQVVKDVISTQPKVVSLNFGH